MDHTQQLIEIVQSKPWLMEALRTCRAFQLPDWAIAAGAIRNTVWDTLHGYEEQTPLNDIDLVYTDPGHLSHEPDVAIWEQLIEKMPQYHWNVFNQARAHLKHPEQPPFTQTIDALHYWSETATCVGVRLLEDDTIEVLAPYGLEDLFSLAIKPVPAPYLQEALYEKRIQSKDWAKTWPKLDIHKIA